MLKLYNSLTRKIDEFAPIKKDCVGLYTCGPTVYWYAHIGNLRTYIFEDILKRVLEYNGYKVKHVMNITDVGHLTSDSDTGEDKLEKGAKREGKSVWEIARIYADAFKKDIKLLNIQEPDIWEKATDTIQEQIDLIKILEQKGFTYKLSDGIYFDTSKLPSYGALWPNKMDLKAGARVEMTEGKKKETDFALWKFSPDPPVNGAKRQMEWDSPWGIGFPGWHTECVVMSAMHLGIPFDIHCGGIDHVLIHHTNEIAQAQAAYGKIPANFWMHGEFMTRLPVMVNNIFQCPACSHQNLLKTEDDYIQKQTENGIIFEIKCQNPKCEVVFPAGIKMSKSTGDIVLLSDIINAGLNPLSLRYLCLMTHYRKKMNYSIRAINAAETALNFVYKKIQEYKQSETNADLSEEAKNYKQKFLEIVNDDLNMPQAIALIWDVIKSDLPDSDKYSLLLDFDKVFGLGFDNIQTIEIPAEIQKLAQERELARQKKDWDKSDQLRGQIEKQGWKIEDSETGPKIKPL